MKASWFLFLVLLLLNIGVCFSIAQDIRIASAYYGLPNRPGIDVTKRVQRFADYGEPFRVGNDTLRIDPSPHHRKALVVIYLVNGRRISDCVQEGEVFYFRTGGEPASNLADRRPAIRIIKALYGVKERYADVTGQLRRLARNRQSFTVSNETFGVDPYRGRQKWLKISYLRGNEHRNQQFMEGTRVQLR